MYFGTWRLLGTLVESHGLSFSPRQLARFMCSVTSHYNLGGGLAPEKALRQSTTQEQALARWSELLRACAVVTVNSTSLRELLTPHVPELVYAPNGVDADFFSPAESRPYGTEPIRVGWAGKIKAAKNVEAIEAAAPELWKLGFELELVGHQKGADRDELLDATEMREFYRRLDWYLCASWHEGTPNPALEAAACGVPLVTTRVGNMVDFVREGENGFFVDPSPEAIVNRFRELRELGADEHARLRAAARAEIERAWTWDRNIEPYREAFDRLLTQAGGRGD